MLIQRIVFLRESDLYRQMLTSDGESIVWVTIAALVEAHNYV
jgi:hypothetical protein